VTRSGWTAQAESHLGCLSSALVGLEGPELARIGRWGEHLAEVLRAGGRLLAAGNGGSAAQAQHLTSELVGRYRDERQPLSAIPLHTDTSSVTAVANDYGLEQAFARQVQAHGRPGDVLFLLSTSGTSPNILAAADTGRTCGLTVLALTGRRPNPLASAADDALSVEAETTATVQEVHQVIVHLLCEAVDRIVIPVSIGTLR
jgi:D-sedoheptulose 7-phosphate isomerase